MSEISVETAYSKLSASGQFRGRLKRGRVIGTIEALDSAGNDLRIRYSIRAEHIYILEEFISRVHYLDESPLCNGSFLKLSTKITMPGSMTPEIRYDTPSEVEINDLLMRMRPFLFAKDIVHWERIGDILLNSVSDNNNTIANMISDFRACMSGEKFDQSMSSAEENARERSTGTYGLGEGSFYYDLSEGRYHLRFSDIKSWLYGHKYHVSDEELFNYRRLSEDHPEVALVKLFRIHYQMAVNALIAIHNLIWIFLIDLKHQSRLSIVGSMRTRGCLLPRHLSAP